MRFRFQHEFASLVGSVILLFTTPTTLAAIHEVTVGDNFFSPAELQSGS